MLPHGLEQVERGDDAVVHVDVGSLDPAPDVPVCGKVENDVDALKKGVIRIGFTQVSLFESEVAIIVKRLDVLPLALAEVVEGDDFPFVQELADEVAADEAGAAGDEVFHTSFEIVPSIKGLT